MSAEFRAGGIIDVALGAGSYKLSTAIGAELQPGLYRLFAFGTFAGLFPSFHEFFCPFYNTVGCLPLYFVLQIALDPI